MKIDEISRRQIDVLIAELMGCKVVDSESIPRCECRHHPHSLELSSDLKFYSADILYAMEVTDKMRADGFNWKAWQPATEDAASPFVHGAIVSFVCSRGPCPKHGNPRQNHHGAYDVEGETLPMAICKAALIALGKLPSEEKP